MFGGIIRTRGKLTRVDLRRGVLHIQARGLIRRLSQGDSVSVDGVCLTVTRRRRGKFHVDVTSETVRRTNFRWARPGRIVNLELPLRLNDLIHGHPVLGHVDGIGYVGAFKPLRTGALLDIWIPPRLCPYTAEKGSIALNGVSLTIANRRGKLIQIALIPETLRRTNLCFLKPGYRVNVEVDVLARYALGKRNRNH